MSYSGATYLELIERGARQNADRIAVVFGDEQQTFAEVNARANQFAHAFASLGANPRTRVALLVNNSLPSIPLDFGCVKAGVNRVPLNSRLSAQEHVRLLQDSQCSVLIFGPDLVERATEISAALPDLRCLGLGTEIAKGGDFLSVAEQQRTEAPQTAVEPHDIVLTLYTSGTTGVLKAAQHTQASYAGICRNVLLNLFPVLPTDSMLHAASMIHASGTFVLPFWLRGAKTVVLPGFAPAAFLEAIERHRVTAVNLVPTMLQMLLESPDLENRDLSSIERIIYGASPMPRSVIDRAIAKFGQGRFWQYYGQTEAPLCLTVLRPEDHHGNLLGACGRPALDVEIRLVDEQGRDVRPGEPGEIVVRGPMTVAGYFNAPSLTSETFREDGWVHTRDVGVFDEGGFLHLRDRTSDMIISGGYNVYPREVEDALLAHPAVLECAVVGAPDEKWVEAVTAFVILRPGQAAQESELIAFASSKIASYKKPRRIVFTQDIPKTAVGKLDRKVLRNRLKPTPGS
ncbi:long-chain fatty acid--CoA ligase [Bradyrhizobium sp. NAS80.1]|uniref:class I adenylate-forming enzyme family protein n=1 Tax=Bradyrhizobium sp. NAS80.1 TaxID=1680159 RepID=UPI0009667C75|nr:AMP-binding protein [Bradyrhizobium sp. NAS80.1]OKO85816.1 long-chain fatty acid--CoA ligase [Bradyrhizobium sp. NAS80.1]